MGKYPFHVYIRYPIIFGSLMGAGVVAFIYRKSILGDSKEQAKVVYENKEDKDGLVLLEAFKQERRNRT